MAFSHALVTEGEVDSMAGELVDTTGWTETNNKNGLIKVEASYVL